MVQVDYILFIRKSREEEDTEGQKTTENQMERL